MLCCIYLFFFILWVCLVGVARGCLGLCMTPFSTINTMIHSSLACSRKKIVLLSANNNIWILDYLSPMCWAIRYATKAISHGTFITTALAQINSSYTHAFLVTSSMLLTWHISPRAVQINNLSLHAFSSFSVAIMHLTCIKLNPCGS